MNHLKFVDNIFLKANTPAGQIVAQQQFFNFDHKFVACVLQNPQILIFQSNWITMANICEPS